MGFFRAVWLDAQSANRQKINTTGSKHYYGVNDLSTEQQGINSEHTQAANNQKELDVSGFEHLQKRSNSAALDSSKTESAASADSVEHAALKVSQQQNFESFETVAPLHVLGSTEELLPVDPIVGKRNALTPDLNGFKPSESLESVVSGLATGEDINRSTSCHTDVRVSQLPRNFRAVGDITRDPIDLSDADDERNFKHAFTNLDKSKPSGLCTPSDYNQTAINPHGDKNNSLCSGGEKRQSAKSIIDDARVDDQSHIQPNTMAVPAIAQCETAQNTKVLLSEHQRYLQQQERYQQAKLKRSVTQQAGNENLQQQPQRENLSPGTKASPPESQSHNASLPRGQESVEFMQLQAQATPLPSAIKTPQQPITNPSLHIGRIDVIVTADARKTPPSPQALTRVSGWASKHYLRRI